MKSPVIGVNGTTRMRTCCHAGGVGSIESQDALGGAEHGANGEEGASFRGEERGVFLDLGDIAGVGDCVEILCEDAQTERDEGSASDRVS